MKSRAAFTLIELLTVIAIIGILAAIIIPTVGKVRASARKATCLSNLRQIGVATNTYMSDQKGALPWALYRGTGPADPSLTWDSALSTYLGSKQTSWVDDKASTVIWCPSDYAREISGYTQPRRSYAMVRGSGGPVYVDGTHMKTLPAARIDAPSQTLLIVERSSPESGAGVNRANFSDACVIDNPSQQPASGKGDDLHDGQYSYLFCDGHVRSMRPLETIGTGISLTSPKGMWTVSSGD